MDHNILPDLIALHLYLIAHNWWTAVFGLMSNVSAHLRSTLLSLGYFTGTDGTYEIGLLSVNISAVDTMADSKICCTAVNRHIC